MGNSTQISLTGPSAVWGPTGGRPQAPAEHPYHTALITGSCLIKLTIFPDSNFSLPEIQDACFSLYCPIIREYQMFLGNRVFISGMSLQYLHLHNLPQLSVDISCYNVDIFEERRGIWWLII